MSAKVNEDVVNPFKFKLTVKETMKVSALVGYRVGMEVRRAAGAKDGMTAGLDLEGARVGIGEGRMAGSGVGMDERQVVGSRVGMGEGQVVGSGVGMGEGQVVGSRVGMDEGRMVGYG